MDGLFLADDALVQALFHVQQLLRFGLHHLVDRDAGPLGDHLGDVVDVHHLIQLVLGFPLRRVFRLNSVSRRRRSAFFCAARS